MSSWNLTEDTLGTNGVCMVKVKESRIYGWRLDMMAVISRDGTIDCSISFSERCFDEWMYKCSAPTYGLAKAIQPSQLQVPMHIVHIFPAA